MAAPTPSTPVAIGLPGTSEPSSALLEPATPRDGPRPLVDGPINMTDYRLEMDIESVYYFRHEKRACCAVLVRTFFCLKDGRLGEICLCLVNFYARDRA
jgi:hypothetical protein